MLFLPELTVLATGLVFFFLSLGSLSGATIRTIAIILYSLVAVAAAAAFHAQGEMFYQVYAVDSFSQTFKLLIALATLVVVIFSDTMPGIKQKFQPEYHMFMAMAVLGLMMLVSSVELLAIFVALELSSFAVYIMVPMREERYGCTIQMEAGMKYLLFGIAATGFMLFGMSYLFGLTGSTRLDIVATSLSKMAYQPVAIIAIAMVLAGFFYKLALFPFHFWVPDVYEGSANETTAFIAAVPKIAAVAMLIRIVSLTADNGQLVVNLLIVCALASMFYGNLSALVQKDLKRMLGFSGIAHAGFVLLGLLTFQITGYANAIYYIAGYAIMNLACFLVICRLAKEGRNLAITDLTGLHHHSPLLALTLTIGLFSLAGIPPFVGFTGKFMLLVEAFKQGHQVVVVLAAINTAIAIYYYLSAVRLTFCSAPEQQNPIQVGGLTNAMSIMLIGVIIIMGIAPSWFLSFAKTAVGAIM